MKQNILTTIGILGPAGLLIAALGFQYLGELYPCTLCIWQRYPHVLTLVIGLGFIKFRHPFLALLAAISCLGGAGLAGFHTGVEYGWWDGLAACSGPGLEGLSGQQLLDFTSPIESTDCAQPAWIFLHLSMAAWNGLASIVLFAVWAALLVMGRPKGDHQGSSSASQ